MSRVTPITKVERVVPNALVPSAGRTSALRSTRSTRLNRRGSVLIIVMWICLGLVALTLYFANSMSSELHAADNRVSEVEARQAIVGATRYANYILTNYATGGTVPNIRSTTTTPDYKAEAVPVGDAQFWFIGRDNDNTDTASPTEPYYALVDESSKLNLNTATSAMLQSLPGMTPDLADAIIAWRSTNTQISGNADNNYTQLDPPRHNKGAPFETTDELRLVNGMTLDLLLGEDTNRNGVLDPNEDDGDQSAPHDDQNGQLLPGFLEYVTVYSRLPTTSASGQRRIDIRTPQSRQLNNQLRTRLTARGIDSGRAGQIVLRAGANTFGSVLEFMLVTQMTSDEWALVHTDLTAFDNATAVGLVNVNTASQTVLACIPGIGPDNAATLVAYRQQNPDSLTNFAWLAQTGVSRGSLIRAGAYLTDESYQFTADIAAVANNGRGYCRERLVFDTTSAGAPRIVFRQDLTPFGWALGTSARQNLRATKNT